MGKHKTQQTEELKQTKSEAVLRMVLGVQKTNYSPPFKELCRMNEEYEGGLRRTHYPPGGRGVLKS